MEKFLSELNNRQNPCSDMVTAARGGALGAWLLPNAYFVVSIPD